MMCARCWASISRNLVRTPAEPLATGEMMSTIKLFPLVDDVALCA
jgi:hypothetical protein